MAHNNSRRSYRILTWILLIVLAMTGIVVFAGYTKTGTRLALATILPVIAKQERQISIEDASPLLANDVAVAKIILSDSDGPWLTIENLRYTWNPLSILTATFDADRISADKITLHRQPNADPQASDGLPLALQIAELDMPEIELAEQFTGKVEKLALAGSLAVSDSKLASDIDLKDLRRANANVAVKVDFDPARNILDVNASADESHGGFISSLLELPGEPAIHLGLAGKGPLNNWQGELVGQVEGFEVLKLKGTYQLPASGKHQLAIEGGGAFDAFLPPNIGSLFGGQSSVSVGLVVDPAGSVEISDGQLKTGSLMLKAHGSLSRSGNNNFALSLQPLGADNRLDLSAFVGSPLFAQVSAADVRVTGPANEAVLKIDARADRLDVASGALEGVVVSALSSAFDLENRQGKLDLRVKIDESRFADAAMDRLLRAPATLHVPMEMSGGIVTINAAKLESASIGGTLEGEFDRVENTANFAFKAYAAPTVLPDNLSSKLDKAIALSGSFIREGHVMKLEALNLESALANAQAEVVLDDDGLHVEGKGDLPDLSQFLSDVQGTAAFSLQAEGPTDNLAIALRTSSQTIAIAQKELKDLDIDLKGNWRAQTLTATVSGTGQIEAQKFEVGAKLARSGEGYVISDIALLAGKNQIGGAINLNHAFAPNGNLAFDLDDVATIAALTGQQIGGQLTGSLRFDNDDGAITAHLAAKAASLSAGASRIDDAVISLEAKGSLLAGLSGQFKATRISAGGNVLARSVLDFVREGEGARFKLTGQYNGAPLEGEGDLQPANGGTTLNLTRFSASPQGIPVRLKSPKRFDIANGNVSFNGLVLDASGGTISATGMVGNQIKLQSRLSGVPAAIANSFVAGLGASGAISGTASVSGRPDDPDVTYKLDWKAAATNQTRQAGLPDLSVAAKGKLHAGNLSIDAGIQGGRGLNIASKGQVGLKGTRQISMSAKGNVPLTILNGKLQRKGIAMSGPLKIDMRISGTTAAPKFSGSISLAKGRLQAPRQNISVKSMEAKAKFDGDKISISSFKGKFSNGGSFLTKGTIGIAPGSGNPIKLTVKLTNASYTDGSLVRARMGRTIEISGTLSGTTELGGEIRVYEATITIPETLPKSLSEIALKHRNASNAIISQAKEIEGEDASGTSGQANLNLRISAPRRIFIRGRGLDAEVGGNVRLRGTASNPIVSGSFSMIRGRLEILGKRLDFTSGRVGFTGDMIPNLDLVSSTTVGTTTIYVTVSGPATSPEFTFTSSDGLPEDEVLAALLFGQNSTGLSALQIAQAADALAQLTGLQSDSFFSRLRNSVGIDDLDVTTDENGKAQVKAGKYLNNKTYLEVQSGDGTSKAAINLDVGKGLKLRGEVGSDGSSAAGFFFEKEY